MWKRSQGYNRPSLADVKLFAKCVGGTVCWEVPNLQWRWWMWRTQTPKICRGRKGLLYCGLENPQQVAKRGMLVHIQFWIPKTINVFTCSGLGHAKAQTNKGSRNRKLVNEGIEPKWTYQRAKIWMKQLSKTLAKSKSARCILDICNDNFLLRPCF